MTRGPSPLPLRRLQVAGETAPRAHVHWYRWDGENPFGNGALYKCRCGEVKPGL